MTGPKSSASVGKRSRSAVPRVGARAKSARRFSGRLTRSHDWPLDTGIGKSFAFRSHAEHVNRIRRKAIKRRIHWNCVTIGKDCSLIETMERVLVETESGKPDAHLAG